MRKGTNTEQNKNKKHMGEMKLKTNQCEWVPRIYTWGSGVAYAASAPTASWANTLTDNTDFLYEPVQPCPMNHWHSLNMQWMPHMGRWRRPEDVALCPKDIHWMSIGLPKTQRGYPTDIQLRCSGIRSWREHPQCVLSYVTPTYYVLRLMQR